MKLKFKIQSYQTDAVNALADCFKGQTPKSSQSYRMDPGASQVNQDDLIELDAFKNAELTLPPASILKNIQAVQTRQSIAQSSTLINSKVCPINLDIEMETGTGKTYCYIKSMFELNKRYGWTKFIVVVPSIAIREGVAKSFKITSEHFLEQYGKRTRFFIYNSKDLHDLENFSSDAGINVMIINIQAFNAEGQGGKDARRIYMPLDDFQSRKPIDVIAANRPILIIDEPQKIEGAKGKESKSFDALKKFNPLMILRYSATHKKEHNKIFRLDAIDAFNKKLVKKIEVRGITVKGLSGTNSYMYLEDSIQISSTKPPEARIEIEVKQKSSTPKRVTRKIKKGDNLYDLSDELDQYKAGYVVSEIDARENTVSFTNGIVLSAGEATGDVNESSLRRIQIRETIHAHFQKEKKLFHKGIKVLSLFFIDEVAKYRIYEDDKEDAGEYARIFEEEYIKILNNYQSLEDPIYNKYLKEIQASKTHQGYFSMDKQKRFINSKTKRSGATAGEADDVDAYDLILKNKERLLSLDEPVRFIFSHSALREGWDNPNVFVICTLKHSDNTITKRQEVGRGMRIAVNQQGDRMDDPAEVHDINELTVVASESYKDFVTALQKETIESLSDRPREANEAFFTGQVITLESGNETIDANTARKIYKYLLKHDLIDDSDHINQSYIEARESDTLPELPDELIDRKEAILKLIDSVYNNAQIPTPEDGRKKRINPINKGNFDKKEFQELWNRINKQAAYSVDFDTEELVEKSITALEKELNVKPLHYYIQKGSQKAETNYDELERGESFRVEESSTEKLTTSTHSSVPYDLLGKLSEHTQLKRKTLASILCELKSVVFNQFKRNPEDFINQTARIINEQKATVVIEHLEYNLINKTHSMDIFTQERTPGNFDKAIETKHHIYDYVFYDSNNEKSFVSELETSSEVVVYSKLPKGFKIPTPVGNYNPDWAIAFKEGAVKHLYFIAETKGSLSSMDLRQIEKSKISCAKKFFAKLTSEEVKYDVVNSYEKLMDLVK